MLPPPFACWVSSPLTRHLVSLSKAGTTQTTEDVAQAVALQEGLLGEVAGLLVGADVEGEDRRTGRLGQEHVALVHTARGSMDDAGADLVIAQLLERLLDGLDLQRHGLNLRIW